jgi:hypothetical protein
MRRRLGGEGGGVVYAEAYGQKDDEGENENDEDHDGNHLLMLPPHLTADGHPSLVEFVRLEAEVVCLVHQVLQVLPPQQHL